MQENNSPQDNKPKFNYYWIYAVIAVILIALNFFSFSGAQKDIEEVGELVEMIEEGDVQRIVVVNRDYAEVYIKDDRLSDEEHSEVGQTSFGMSNTGPHYRHKIMSLDKFEEKIDAAQATLPAEEDHIKVIAEERHSIIGPLLGWVVPIILLVAIWIFIMRRVGGGAGGAGGQIFNIGRSKATLFDKDAKVDVTFKDVAGLDEAKEEVMEVVDFLKNPTKYTNLGGKIPKGVLLVGPPGTGKTLMAKAMAGEAAVPFFSISGSDFVEMFVGVGASRVRDLFKQARDKAPCIIFIDEIDAIGRARGRNSMQGNDERENTLNQLLVEMDGFSTDKGVIIVAATNRPDILDSALLRPGRFDRQIGIDKPDLTGREQIFKVHLKSLTIGEDVEAKKLAMQTPGFAGAEIANICNEAALIAARKSKKAIEMQDFHDAIDRVIGGLEKKTKLISPEEKRVIAYHEAGHAISGWFLEYADPLVKVSIVPRGMAALGYAQYLPKEKNIVPKEHLLDHMCGLLAGRAAEEIVFGKISTGAQNDLDRVTKMAYSIITVYGMNDKVGNVSFYGMMNENQFARPYSEQTAQMIDSEVRNLISQEYDRAKQLLNEKRKELELLASELLNKEVLLKEDVARLVGKRPYDDVPGENGEKAKGDDSGVDTLLDKDNDDELPEIH
ncbi:MAG: ATP-dependent zinc metalloprotease FtsH [Aureispira sp.]|nr:ATP-dependent zinc metalloprotease FtsH [Aureispira sp.]